jgi:hypothetical protein
MTQATTMPPNPSDRLVPFVTPTVTLLGTVEELTGAFRHGVPDLLGHGNIL